MRQLVIVIAAFSLSCTIRAQDAAFTDLAARLERVVAGVDSRFACTLAVPGEPRRDADSGRWLAAFSASGEDCDAAIDALRDAGRPLDVVFFRRPTPAQLKVLVADMVRAVEAATACRITVREDPQLQDGSSRWFLSYRAAGNGCDEAAEALRSRGREYDILFIRMPEIGLIR